MHSIKYLIVKFIIYLKYKCEDCQYYNFNFYIIYLIALKETFLQKNKIFNKKYICFYIYFYLFHFISLINNLKKLTVNIEIQQITFFSFLR